MTVSLNEAMVAPRMVDQTNGYSYDSPVEVVFYSNVEESLGKLEDKEYGEGSYASLAERELLALLKTLDVGNFLPAYLYRAERAEDVVLERIPADEYVSAEVLTFSMRRLYREWGDFLPKCRTQVTQLLGNFDLFSDTPNSGGGSDIRASAVNNLIVPESDAYAVSKALVAIGADHTHLPVNVAISTDVVSTSTEWNHLFIWSPEDFTMEGLLRTTKSRRTRGKFHSFSAPDLKTVCRGLVDEEVTFKVRGERRYGEQA